MIFFITLFRYFTIVLFFTLHFFSFSQGMQTRERAHCARSVFPFIKKKKYIDIYFKLKITFLSVVFLLLETMTHLRDVHMTILYLLCIFTNTPPPPPTTT